MMTELERMSATIVGSVPVSDWLLPPNGEAGWTADCGATAWPGLTAPCPPPEGTPSWLTPMRYIAFRVFTMSSALVWRRCEM